MPHPRLEAFNFSFAHITMYSQPTIRSIPLRCCCLCACASALLVSQLCTEFLFIIFQRAFNRLALPKKHHEEVRLIVSHNTQLISLILLRSRELLLILLINCDHKGIFYSSYGFKFCPLKDLNLHYRHMGGVLPN